MSIRAISPCGSVNMHAQGTKTTGEQCMVALQVAAQTASTTKTARRRRRCWSPDDSEGDILILVVLLIEHYGTALHAEIYAYACAFITLYISHVTVIIITSQKWHSHKKAIYIRSRKYVCACSKVPGTSLTPCSTD